MIIKSSQSRADHSRQQTTLRGGKISDEKDTPAPKRCGPAESVEADGEGLTVRDAVRAATQNAIDVCALYKGCDDLNPKCLFAVTKVKVTDIADNRKKATVTGHCECGQREVLPGD